MNRANRHFSNAIYLWAPFLIPALFFTEAASLQAQSAYFKKSFFDNSLTPDKYFHSAGKASVPSTLSLINGKLPVETGVSFTPPNALRLQWKSMPSGGWEAEIRLYEWRNRDIYFPGDTLYFYCYSDEPIRSRDLPRMVLKDKWRNFTKALDISPFVQDIPAHRWTKVEVPLNRFETASLRPFEPHRVNSIFFIQGAADQTPHTLIVDEFRFDNHDLTKVPALAPVRNVQAKGYERHIDISWEPVNQDGVARYVIYRSENGGKYVPVGIQVPGIHRYADYVGKPGVHASYKVAASDAMYHESKLSEAAEAATHPMSDDDLLTMVQEACFRYYWEGAHPNSGTTRENTPGDDDMVATGASGFGIMALIVGVDRGFITREQGLHRMLKIVSFLEKADRFHGAWPHFLSGTTGHRMAVFGMYDNGADLVETAFLTEGLLSARQYFKGSSPEEKELYQRITNLWKGIDWAWFRRTPDGDYLFWHWSPEYSWHINHRLTGWNEVMITYLLAVASPTHPIPGKLYYTGWASDHYFDPHTYEGIELKVGQGSGGPLFFTHYSYMGFDSHMSDRFTDYFNQNRAMARINRAYCIKDPGHYKGYGANDWGITAVDGPDGYVPYEPNLKLDDGTIAPTGAISSFPYTPEASMDALKFFYRQLGDRLWGVYGFRDAFNLQEDWFSRIYMGLNQAPMTVMIENYRSGLIWKNFMANPEIAPMMERIGLKPDAAEKRLLK